MFKSFFENVRKPKNNFGGRVMVKGMNRGHEKLASWGRGFLEIDGTDTVIDLGCGGGRNVEFFLTKAEKVYGIYYSSTSVEIASKLNEKEIKAGRCEIIQADVTVLPFEDESVDIVSAFETIYFWPNLESSFKEIYRVLKPKGQLLICNEGSDRNNDNIKKWSDMLEFPVYSGEELKKMLEPLGFQVSYKLNDKKNITLLAKKI